MEHTLRYTFENFITGAANRPAFEAAQSMTFDTCQSGKSLLICGESGVGKTHLLFAMLHALQKCSPAPRVRFVEFDQLVSELVEAIQGKQLPEYYSACLQQDVLLVDSAPLLKGKQATWQEIHGLFGSLCRAGRRVVLAVTCHPKAIEVLPKCTHSQFEWGFIQGMSFPDYAVRLDFVRQKASTIGLDLPENVATYIALRHTGGFRQLEGAVIKMKNYFWVEEIYPSIPVAQSIIRDSY